MSIEFTEEFNKLTKKIEEIGEIPNLGLSSIAKSAAQEALNSISNALQPVQGQFQGRKGKNSQSSHQGGDLKNLLSLKREKGKKGKSVYCISTTWYTHFKDAGFTTRSGKKVSGSQFLTGTMDKLDAGLKLQMEVGLMEKIKTICET